MALMKVYLLHEELFLEPAIAQLTWGIFGSLCNSKDSWNFEAMTGPKISGFIEDFVLQFAAVSYGNSVFAALVRVFLMMDFPSISYQSIFLTFF